MHFCHMPALNFLLIKMESSTTKPERLTESLTDKGKKINLPLPTLQICKVGHCLAPTSLSRLPWPLSQPWRHPHLVSSLRLRRLAAIASPDRCCRAAPRLGQRPQEMRERSRGRAKSMGEKGEQQEWGQKCHFCPLSIISSINPSDFLTFSQNEKVKSSPFLFLPSSISFLCYSIPRVDRLDQVFSSLQNRIISKHTIVSSPQTNDIN